MPSPFGCHFVTRERRVRERAIKAFCDWMLEPSKALPREVSAGKS
jgi:hypothetical protein